MQPVKENLVPWKNTDPNLTHQVHTFVKKKKLIPIIDAGSDLNSKYWIFLEQFSLITLKHLFHIEILKCTKMLSFCNSGSYQFEKRNRNQIRILPWKKKLSDLIWIQITLLFGDNALLEEEFLSKAAARNLLKYALLYLCVK